MRPHLFLWQRPPTCHEPFIGVSRTPSCDVRITHTASKGLRHPAQRPRRRGAHLGAHAAAHTQLRKWVNGPRLLGVLEAHSAGASSDGPVAYST